MKKNPQGGNPLTVNPDTQWFDRMFEKVGVYKRTAAQRMGVDPAIMTRLINGKNNWSLEYALEVAKILNVTLRQLLVEGLRVDVRRYEAVLGPAAPAMAAPAPAADQVHESAAGYASVPVIGYLDDQGAAWPNSGSTAGVEAPTRGKVEALRLRSIGPFDGTLVYVSEAKRAADCLGKLCLVQSPTAALRIVRRGSSADRFDLVSPRNPMERVPDATVDSVRPVEWIRVA